MTSKDEPGEPMHIEGRVLAPDGVTPAAGIVVYVYQTDIQGIYHREAGHAPRIRGWMRTDERGRFAYRTIRPAPYPGTRIAAHVHTQLWGPGYPAQFGTTLRFADDPLLSEDERERAAARGAFAGIRPLGKKRGVWRGTHQLRLGRDGDRFQSNIRHGLDDAPKGLRPSG